MKTLAIAAGIVFWTLVIGVAVLVFFPGGNEGEPVAVLQVEPAPPATTAPTPSAGNRNLDLPPGFSVTGPAVSPSGPPARPQAPNVAPPGEGTTMMPVTPGQPAQPAAPGPGGSLQQNLDRQGQAPSPEGEATAQADIAPARPEQQVSEADLRTGIDDTGTVPLADVPAAGLFEESQYGPLPRIAADGRRPAEVYARPSRYAQAAGGPPRVAVLVNGLGVPGAPDADIIKGLPPPVSIAYGAYGRSLQERVTQARAEGHEVLLAIPLEPNDYPDEDPGPHTLLTSLPTNENIKRLHWLMSRYTGYAGVTNHMGAKFHTDEGSLRLVLEDLKKRGLIYVADGSVDSEAGRKIANELGLGFAVAHVRLDTGTSESEMAKSLADLEAAAKTRGAAIGVAKAAPATVKQIAEWAGSLESKGLVLVPVTAAMRVQRQI